MSFGRTIALVSRSDDQSEVIGEIRVDEFGGVTGVITDSDMIEKLSDVRQFSFFKLEV